MNGPDKPDDSTPENDDSDEIINDLESIKHLLLEEDAEVAQTLDDEVPLLDDQVEGGVSINENMGDDTFDTLLGDAWQDSVEELFSNARSHIEQNSTDWLPEHTDELSEALKIRIDASVRAWLAKQGDKVAESAGSCVASGDLTAFELTVSLSDGKKHVVDDFGAAKLHPELPDLHAPSDATDCFP